METFIHQILTIVATKNGEKEENLTKLTNNILIMTRLEKLGQLSGLCTNCGSPR